MTTHVPLSALLSGGEIDSRSTGLKDGLKELAASIEAHGLILPLAVRDVGDGGYQVVDGNRRLEALKMLAKKKRFAKDAAIAVNVIEASDDKAREASLAANIVREPMHPVDQFEAFAALAAAGQTAAQIAGRFGITERHVKQRMALGALHPDIRAEWRKGKIDQEAAQAFTIARNLDEQKQVFGELKKKGLLYAHTIRSRLGSNQEVAGALRAIRLDAYKAAGGTVIEDLFGDNNVIDNPDLVRRLYGEAMKAECDRLLALGWSFALDEATVDEAWRWPKLEIRDLMTDEERARWDEIEARLEEIGESGDDEFADEEKRLNAELDAITEAVNARGAPAEIKASAGCFVSPRIGGAGFEAEIVRRPRDAAEPKASADEPGEATDAAKPAEPTISNALAAKLSEQLTAAAARTLAHHPNLALNVAVAALCTPAWATPAKLSERGMPAALADGDVDLVFDSFDAALAALSEMRQADVLAMLARRVAASLDLRATSAEALAKARGADDAPAAALLRRLDAADYLGVARSTFDAPAYFNGVPAAMCHAALDEMEVAKAGRPKKKKELALSCASKATALGWLPPELRHPAAPAHADAPA